MLVVSGICFSDPASAATLGEDNSAAAIVREMNLARQNPALYAGFIDELRPQFNGTLQIIPGRLPLRTKEGARALDDAIRFLRKVPPQTPLNFSAGMSRAAADHCAEQAGGGMTHSGRGWSGPGERISHYGVWSGTWGENISCGRTGAREIVLALIIDDGLGSRKHRKNIFSSSFTQAGAAVGPHATYHTVCTIDFAGGYAEKGDASGTLVARNF
ncbi:MAG: CAP domain-containing protein [Verrucomicrobiota bacterium]|nr:CAP domain-containing protein [Verrucomicrobiota bacterium]